MEASMESRNIREDTLPAKCTCNYIYSSDVYNLLGVCVRNTVKNMAC